MPYLSKQALSGLKHYHYKPGGYTILDNWHQPLWNCECMRGWGCLQDRNAFLPHLCRTTANGREPAAVAACLLQRVLHRFSHLSNPHTLENAQMRCPAFPPGWHPM